MTRADLGCVIEIAASLPNAPQWPQSAYLTALDPASTPRRIALVAVSPQTENLQGFIIGSVLAPQAELETIAVAPACQRQGLGRLLFHSLAGELRSAGAGEIVLEVRVSNLSAVGFYRSLGFSQAGVRRAYYKAPVEDALLMTAPLS